MFNAYDAQFLIMTRGQTTDGRTDGRQQATHLALNSLDSKGNYSATSNNTNLVHWLLMGGLFHMVQQGRAWAGCNSPPINGQCTNFILLSASLTLVKEALIEIGCVVTSLVGCHASALWPNGAS